MDNIIKQWNNAAQQYVEFQENSEHADINKQVVKTRFKDLQGKKVLDLGCGYGYYTDYFNSIGANAVGVDVSDEMIGLARKRYSRCEFWVSDITKKLPFEKESFDMVFCNQVLMDVEDIEGVLCECNRVLKDSGILYYSIVHPAFYDGIWLKDKNGFKYAKAIGKYINSYSFANDFWGETMHFHRPLSYYLNMAASCGFCLQHIEEPICYDGITKTDEIPLFFFAEYIKDGKLPYPSSP